MTRLLKTIPLLIVMFFALVGTAAAQSSWLPTYSSTQKIYVAPGVDAALAQSFSNRDMVSNLQDAARVHNLDVYVIVTASGNDAGSDARQAGPVLVRKLWDTWTKLPGFNSDRTLIILMTGDGSSLTSVGVRAGGYLNGLGIQRNTMNDTAGPVIPVLRSYLASDPASVPGHIVVNINTIVTSKITPPATTVSGQPEGNSSMGIGTILLIVGGLLAAATLFIVATRPRHTNSTYTPPTPRPRTTLSKSPAGGSFDGRLRDARRQRETIADGGTDDDTRRRNDDGVNTATAVGAGVIGGVLLSEAARRNDDDDRRSSSGSTDSGYVAPVSTPSCSTPSSSPSCSSSSSSGSSCSSSSGSSCGGGGGSSCGGGGGGF